MASKIILERLDAVLKALSAGHAGDLSVSSFSQGLDRELFINLVLSNIISVPFRTGTGDIIDRHDHISGQADIVIEYMNTLSFPNIYPSAARLYLAESVCAVIEVKSTLSVQWKNVVTTAKKLAALDRHVGAVHAIGKEPPKKNTVIRGWL